MRMRVQQSSEVRGRNALRFYDDGAQAAIVLVRAGDEESLTALAKVFGEHRALTVDLERAVPDSDRTVGDCVIRDDGVLLTMTGVGRSIMGLSMNLGWGKTSHSWRSVALKTGHVWIGLISEKSYQEAFSGDALTLDNAHPGAPRIPPLPVLKLEVVETAG